MELMMDHAYTKKAQNTPTGQGPGAEHSHTGRVAPPRPWDRSSRAQTLPGLALRTPPFICFLYHVL